MGVVVGLFGVPEMQLATMTVATEKVFPSGSQCIATVFPEISFFGSHFNFEKILHFVSFNFQIRGSYRPSLAPKIQWTS